MNGLNSLYETYMESKGCEAKVNHSQMFWIFRSREMVKNWFQDGKPLSCFCLDNNYHEIHVAVALGDSSEMKEKDDDFAYLTFNYNVHVLPKRECGVHFCEFELVDRITTAKKSALNFTDYAVMLPFKKKERYMRQYTLIYSDWEVLICERHNVKGRAPVSRDLYDKIWLGAVGA